MTEHTSRAREIIGYSFLVALADDGIVEADELAFLERLALESGEPNADERDALARIFDRVDESLTDPAVLAEIRRFRADHNI